MGNTISIPAASSKLWRRAREAVRAIKVAKVEQSLDATCKITKAPRFQTTLRRTTGRDGGKGSYKDHGSSLNKSQDRSSKSWFPEDRIEGDLVLQNGENIFTLQLGFPFRSKQGPNSHLLDLALPHSAALRLTISAAGWTRATVGRSLRQGGSVPRARRTSLRLGW